MKSSTVPTRPRSFAADSSAADVYGHCRPLDEPIHYRVFRVDLSAHQQHQLVVKRPGLRLHLANRMFREPVACRVCDAAILENHPPRTRMPSCSQPLVTTQQSPAPYRSGAPLSRIQRETRATPPPSHTKSSRCHFVAWPARRPAVAGSPSRTGTDYSSPPALPMARGTRSPTERLPANPRPSGSTDVCH